MLMKKLSEDHYIIMNDSEIKEGDWIGFPNLKKFVPVQYFGGDLTGGEKKITHSTQPIEYEVVDVTPTGDAIEGYVYDKIQELSLSEVKELLGDVNKVEELSLKMGLELYVGGNYDFENGVRKGYNQALEDNKEKKYTEDDLKKAICIAKDSMGVDNDGETCYSHLSTEQIIQSLQPQTEWEVEIVDGKLKLIQ